MSRGKRPMPEALAKPLYTPPQPEPDHKLRKPHTKQREHHLDQLLALLFGPADEDMTDDVVLQAVMYHAGRYMATHRRLMKWGSIPDFYSRVGLAYMHKPVDRNRGTLIEGGKPPKSLTTGVGPWVATVLETGLLPALLSRAIEKGRGDA